jgi:hypothetical protein
MTYSEERKHRDYLQIGQNLEDENTLAFVKQFYASDDKSAIHRKAMSLLKLGLEIQEDYKNNPDKTIPAQLADLLQAIQTGQFIDTMDPKLVWFVYVASKMYVDKFNIDTNSETLQPKYLNGKLLERIQYLQGDEDNIMIVNPATRKAITDECLLYKKAIMNQVVKNAHEKNTKLEARLETLEAKLASQDVIPNLLEISSINEEIVS